MNPTGNPPASVKSNSEVGITLVEIVIAIFIVALFSVILVANFPEIQKQYALSGATYKLAQDFRRAQDLGLSAVQLKDVDGSLITVKGYGVYFNLEQSDTEYIIYADVGNQADQKYNGDFSNTLLCSNQSGSATDCIIEKVDVSLSSLELRIENINNINLSGKKYTSINFSPPSPIINIENLNSGTSEIGIVLGLISRPFPRTVKVNTSGLISVQ